MKRLLASTKNTPKAAGDINTNA